jgi:subtilisin family serine protease
MSPFDTVRLTPLLEKSSGRPEITVGLIDGPVALDHPDFAGQRIREITGSAACTNRDSAACAHGTFVAGMLAAKRGSLAPAICPGCTFLLRPIFSEARPRHGDMPTATPGELASAIIDSVQAGARVLNLSVNLTGSSGGGESHLVEALNFAASRGVIPVVAAPNQGAEATSMLTRHAWALPVVACDRMGRPLQGSNLSAPVGRRGISAPGKEITSLGTNGNPLTISGTSAATAFVTGTIALLWSELPAVRAADMRYAVTNHSQRRAGLVPPMLNAWSTYRALTGGLWPH